MLVLRVAIVVLIVHAGADIELAQEAGVHELAESAVDGGPAYLKALALHLFDQAVGVEMIVFAEDIVDHVALLLGKALRARSAGEVFPKLLQRTLRNFDAGQMHAETPHEMSGSGTAGPEKATTTVFSLYEKPGSFAERLSVLLKKAEEE